MRITRPEVNVNELIESDKRDSGMTVGPTFGYDVLKRTRSSRSGRRKVFDSSQNDRSFAEDSELQRIRAEFPSWAEERIDRLSGRIHGELDELARVANENPPRLERYDARGERIDRVDYHPAYREMERIAFEETGLIWLHHDPAFTSEHGRVPRKVPFALGYLFAQAEQGLYCPICLTDGTATVLSRHAEESLREKCLPRLAARRYEDLWQGAMFLTEREGGSDVGRSETRAVEDGVGWRLHGLKWFCSNASAELALALARPEGAPDGTGGLGLFAVPRWQPDGSLNECHLLRLKDKLGTRSMATGEIRLDGAFAYRVASPPDGFRVMTEMLNLSRLYNAVASVAVLRRAYVEAKEHASRRIAFGKRIADHPLCARTLSELEASWRDNFRLAFHAIDHYEQMEATGDETSSQIVRLLTPLVKYTTARAAVQATLEAMEILGGDGYCENFVTARLLRDAQVLPIWEGTTNILVLDALRAISREGTLTPLLEEVRERLEKTGDDEGLAEADRLETLLARCKDPAFEGEAREACDRLTALVVRSLR
jgi:alkylation response protein AidB-like acyl-CoA dehydrogenase